MKTFEHKRVESYDEVLILQNDGFELVSAVSEFKKEVNNVTNYSKYGNSSFQKIESIPITAFYLKKTNESNIS